MAHSWQLLAADPDTLYLHICTKCQIIRKSIHQDDWLTTYTGGYTVQRHADTCFGDLSPHVWIEVEAPWQVCKICGFQRLIGMIGVKTTGWFRDEGDQWSTNYRACIGPKPSI